LPVTFLSAGHRFAPRRGRSARIDTVFVAQMGLCKDDTMRLGHREKGSESIQVQTLDVDSSLRGPTFSATLPSEMRSKPS
jgi:hypothetical protein